MRIKNKRAFSSAFLSMSLTLGVSAATYAQETATLQGVARDAVMTNPGVLAAFHEYQAAVSETDVARGNYLPKIDVDGSYGKEWIDNPLFQNEYDFTRDRVAVQLTQMLFDGFETRNEVRRLNQATRTRYYETLQASEQTAAEAARAYLDVLRHRELVALSEENYATHRLTYDQIERRTKAGVSRRVDLEQAAGRLALAESNLLTDTTNLFDVSRRYQRVTGNEPAAVLEKPDVPDNLLPPTLGETLEQAYASSPLMNAAVANVWSTQAGADAVKSRFMPRFDIRARQDIWHDKENIDGRYDEAVVEVAMTYNIYNGGADQALRKQQLLKTNVAMNVRDETCRNIRQDVSIGYNNVKRLDEQLDYLDRHQLSIEKAREAYRGQFDIGKRTLLDLLDTQNEYYEARRAYTNAEFDRQISYLQTLAGMGNLVAALALGDRLHDIQKPDEYDELEPDMYAICPPTAVDAMDIDKEEIFRKAMEKQGLMRPRNSGDGSVMPYMKGGMGELDDRSSGRGAGLNDIYSVKPMNAWLKPDTSKPLSDSISDIPPEFAFIELGKANNSVQATRLSADLPGLSVFEIPEADGTVTVFTGPYQDQASADKAKAMFPPSEHRKDLVVRQAKELKKPS